MKLEFPLLTKDDIEVRIGQMSKDGTKASLLLYQDARCGMKYLDQVVGPMNWQKRFYEVRGLVICSLGVYDTETKTWTWKDDTGSAGTIEEEKSIISDSFKRCCVCFGLARELYTAPTIWVRVESKYDKFFVSSISYNENKEIKTIEIVNEKGEVVYSYGKGRNTSQNVQNEPKQAINEPKGSITSEDLDYINRFLASPAISETSRTNFYNYLDKNFGTMNPEVLTKSQGQEVVDKINGRKRR